MEPKTTVIYYTTAQGENPVKEFILEPFILKVCCEVFWFKNKTLKSFSSKNLGRVTTPKAEGNAAIAKVRWPVNGVGQTTTGGVTSADTVVPPR